MFLGRILASVMVELPSWLTPVTELVEVVRPADMVLGGWGVWESRNDRIQWVTSSGDEEGVNEWVL